MILMHSSGAYVEKAPSRSKRVLHLNYLVRELPYRRGPKKNPVCTLVCTG